jgi:hypothetical protein
MRLEQKSLLQLSLNSLPSLYREQPKQFIRDAEKVCPQPALCPLNKVRVGMAVRVKQLSAPPDVIHRLREMGFCEEQQIRLLSHQSSIVCLVLQRAPGNQQPTGGKHLVEPLAAQQAGA